jgi:quinol monooxygenase YgiN
MTMKYALINKMTTKPGKRQEVIDIMLESGKLFNDNPSCLMYVVAASVNDPNVIWVQDIWENKEDHESAMQSDEMSAFIKQAMPLLEGMPEQFPIELVGGKSDIL